jgi:hypothetical protein
MKFVVSEIYLSTSYIGLSITARDITVPHGAIMTYIKTGLLLK